MDKTWRLIRLVHVQTPGPSETLINVPVVIVVGERWLKQT